MPKAGAAGKDPIRQPQRSRKQPLTEPTNPVAGDVLGLGPPSPPKQKFVNARGGSAGKKIASDSKEDAMGVTSQAGRKLIDPAEPRPDDHAGKGSADLAARTGVPLAHIADTSTSSWHESGEHKLHE